AWQAAEVADLAGVVRAGGVAIPHLAVDDRPAAGVLDEDDGLAVGRDARSVTVAGDLLPLARFRVDGDDATSVLIFVIAGRLVLEDHGQVDARLFLRRQRVLVNGRHRQAR